MDRHFSLSLSMWTLWWILTFCWTADCAVVSRVCAQGCSHTSLHFVFDSAWDRTHWLDSLNLPAQPYLSTLLSVSQVLCLAPAPLPAPMIILSPLLCFYPLILKFLIPADRVWRATVLVSFFMLLSDFSTAPRMDAHPLLSGDVTFDFEPTTLLSYYFTQ